MEEYFKVQKKHVYQRLSSSFIPSYSICRFCVAVERLAFGFTFAYLVGQSTAKAEEICTNREDELGSLKTNKLCTKTTKERTGAFANHH